MAESRFISSAVPGIPQHWARDQQAQVPCQVSLGIPRRKKELHLFPPCCRGAMSKLGVTPLSVHFT